VAALNGQSGDRCHPRRAVAQMLHAHGLIYFFAVDRGPLNMARNLADLGLSDTRSHIPRIFGTRIHQWNR
jgi:hypothetical protein